MKDINTELFKRYSPKNKIAMIESLNTEELMNVKESTALRIVKEVGKRMYKTIRKELYISRDRRAGNDWNAWVVGFYMGKDGQLYVNNYIQYSNTDTNDSVPFNTFFRKGEYMGTIEGCDMYANYRCYYYKYNTEEKANVIKSLLLEYVYTKYKDKLES